MNRVMKRNEEKVGTYEFEVSRENLILWKAGLKSQIKKK